MAPSKPNGLRDFVRDEAGVELAEYAIVLASLSILAMMAFNFLGVRSTTAEQTDANNFTNAGTVSYTNSGSP